MSLISIIRRKENRKYKRYITYKFDNFVRRAYRRHYVLSRIYHDQFQMINVTRHVSLNHFSSRIYPLYIYLNQNTEIFNYSYICLHAHKIFIFYKFVYLYFT